ncbi:MAG: O-methyltransferase [Pseudoflavonifractor sp.]|nr:O-methyltransferase [Pseudoflavonifractor sp.]
MLDQGIEEYILAHIDPEPEALRRLNRDTHLYHLYSRMCSGHYQGRLLKMLTAMIRPRHVLELGTFTGYSALCMAEALEGDAMIDTVEIDDELEDFIREHLDRIAGSERIRLHIGAAEDVLPTIEGEFDMAFIDANKRHYIEYYEMVLPRMVKGGFILADNTLWDGKVTDTKANHDLQTLGITAFNDHVAADPRVERVILPIRDGLTIIRVL